MVEVARLGKDKHWVHKKIVEKLATLNQVDGKSTSGSSVGNLPPRAREVLGFIAQGLSNGEIATKLGINRNTGRNHVSLIYTKIGVHRRSAAIVWARERGLASPARC